MNIFAIAPARLLAGTDRLRPPRRHRRKAPWQSDVTSRAKEEEAVIRRYSGQKVAEGEESHQRDQQVLRGTRIVASVISGAPNMTRARKR
jgi:hypothetical protein